MRELRVLSMENRVWDKIENCLTSPGDSSLALNLGDSGVCSNSGQGVWVEAYSPLHRVIGLKQVNVYTEQCL